MEFYRLLLFILSRSTCIFCLHIFFFTICFAKPNIIFILTDDQDTEIGGQVPIPKTRKLIGNGGIIFQNTFVSSPLCCPSRSSILTGKYVHNHHTVNNSLAGGCSSQQWRREQEKFAFPVHLKRAGYTMMFAGKYLNQYGNLHTMDYKHVPPGWDHWYGLVGNSKYYNYFLSVNATLEEHKDDYEKDYFTDYLHRRAIEFIRQQSEGGRPFFLMLSTPACHAPFTPANPYKLNFTGRRAPRHGSFNVKAKNKHWLIQQPIVPMPNTSITLIDDIFVNRWRTLLSVDDMVEDIYNVLQQANLLDNTFIFFSSDNGYHLGQFGLPYDKRQLYEFDIRVPLMVRGPGIHPGQVTEENAMNIDLAPTFLEIAGQSVPDYMDGKSLTDVWSDFRSMTGAFRGSVLVEHRGEHAYSVPGCPQYTSYGLDNCDSHCVCEDSWNNTFSCVRSDYREVAGSRQSLKYCRFADTVNFLELYNLTADRYELDNIAHTASAQLLAYLKSTLEKLSKCSGILCRMSVY